MKHPLAIAWDAWRASDEGQHCLSVTILKDPTYQQYLENRLWRAFQAGCEAGLVRSTQLLRMRPAKPVQRLVKGHSLSESELSSAAKRIVRYSPEKRPEPKTNAGSATKSVPNRPRRSSARL